MWSGDRSVNRSFKTSKFYSIIADEAADSSYNEQMSLVLHFVDINMNIQEEFIAFLQCRWGLSGEQLAKLIVDALNELTLSIDDCRGQGYDGAGAVAGHINIPFEDNVRNYSENESQKRRLVDVCQTRWVERH